VSSKRRPREARLCHVCPTRPSAGGGPDSDAAHGTAPGSQVQELPRPALLERQAPHLVEHLQRNEVPVVDDNHRQYATGDQLHRCAPPPVALLPILAVLHDANACEGARDGRVLHQGQRAQVKTLPSAVRVQAVAGRRQAEAVASELLQVVIMRARRFIDRRKVELLDELLGAPPRRPVLRPYFEVDIEPEVLVSGVDPVLSCRTIAQSAPFHQATRMCNTRARTLGATYVAARRASVAVSPCRHMLLATPIGTDHTRGWDARLF
jgi:hypothetical protein